MDDYEHLYSRLCLAIATFIETSYSSIEKRCRAALALMESFDIANTPTGCEAFMPQLVKYAKERGSLSAGELLTAFRQIKAAQVFLRKIIDELKHLHLATHPTRFNVLEFSQEIEQSIASEAKAASVLAHRGDTGRVRELFVARFLNRFLPRTVILGNGEIVNGIDAGRSFQQDIVLYRETFPVIQFHSSQIFFAEGVLATAEVKSHLDKKQLIDCWKKIASVRALEPSLLGSEVRMDRYVGDDFPVDREPAPGEVEARIRAGVGFNAPDPLLATPPERIQTYVFAYSADSDQSLNGIIRELIKKHGTLGLPDMIVILQRSIGLRSDDRVLANRQTPSSPNSLPSLTLRHNAAPLGWLLAHMWRGVIGRRNRLPLLRPYFGDFADKARLTED